jgi:hypothetical protein
MAGGCTAPSLLQINEIKKTGEVVKNEIGITMMAAVKILIFFSDGIFS